MFDSGIGGLALFERLTKTFPNENICYLADSKNFPYGTKEPSQIIQYSLQNIAFLEKFKTKLIIIACFTASALALESILASTSIPILNVLDSMVASALDSKSQKMAILGTKATINSKKIQDPLINFGKQCFPIICTDLVEAVENNDRQLCESWILELHKFFLANEIDTVMLACTHFFHLVPMMSKIWKDIQILDGFDNISKQISTVGFSIKHLRHRFFSTNEEGLPIDHELFVHL